MKWRREIRLDRNVVFFFLWDSLFVVYALIQKFIFYFYIFYLSSLNQTNTKTYFPRKKKYIILHESLIIVNGVNNKGRTVVLLN